jgi:multiple sugar transport system ATP-binding protein
MVFQSYGLYPHMSVADNIGYPLRLRGVPAAERAARIATAASQVELGDYLTRKPGALSGGQRQRVALARAIVRTPRVFLMDEPLSNLDAKLRVSMRAQIKHMQYDLGVTTIYVTHDQIEAMTLADRVAVMNKGVIRQLDTPATIYDRPADLFVAGFVGSPAMNLIAGHSANGVFEAKGWRLSAPNRFAGPVILGVRPEDIRVVGPEAGEAAASIYAVELTGESVLVTCDTPAGRVVSRMGRDFRGTIGATARLALTPHRLHLFDAASERRID